MKLSTSLIFGFAVLSKCVMGKKTFHLDNTEFFSMSASGKVVSKTPEDTSKKPPRIKMSKLDFVFKGYGDIKVEFKWDALLNLEVKPLTGGSYKTFKIRAFLAETMSFFALEFQLDKRILKKKKKSTADEFEECYRSFRVRRKTR